ncbi:hypothetical protein V496_04512 [Pseudogymnoascus sp. VKM F-4515 (FW-2607)]|nr:hypothetical protein V496_04512 [Pseudogymnoascus sp. VKM F-4515 (FW-2607)]KFY99486.1 hypothetical protein V498_00715 [Pseudogymnoascus sp. VKM F-4517 (FW-2822)]
MAKALLPLTITGGCLAVFTTTWLHAVNRNVPSPYMDEIFHIPQAQQYCASDFHTWDPKLTTPPGLYAFSLLLKAATRAGCTGADLRSIGSVALAALLVVSYYLRKLLSGSTQHVDRAWKVAHEALNVCLFPPLFFFSGLYYTDVLSTLVIVVAYFAFQRGAGGASLRGGLLAYGLGVVGLVMRQTNVFWVGVFLAGMEWIRTCTDMTAKEPNQGGQGKDKTLIERTLGPYTRGELHDPPLEESGPLGDKSNHVATLHLTQMLYLWPFIAFFSFPLFVPTIVSAFFSPTLPRASTLTWAILAIALSLGIVHFNTLIHPFTLADNRHYMFYVFRYTILRHPLIKYALAPIYVLCGWFVLHALCKHQPISFGATTSSQETLRRGKLSRSAVRDGGGKRAPETKTSFALIWLLTTALSLITAPLVEPRYFILPWMLWRLHVQPTHGSLAGLSVESTRLWGETLWFLAVNVGTCAVFLGKEFEWASEPGNVQRFMW